MRRREKFVIAAILLSLGLWVVQYVDLNWRYLAVGALAIVSYLVSAWALSDDLQPLEWLTIIPFPALYTAAVGLFYFLLPTHFLTKITILALFCVGVYALYLTSNIFSVAKGRTIQLIHAAHAISLLFILLTSIFFTNTLFSLKFPWFINGLALALGHFPLVLMSLWSVDLAPKISREVWGLTIMMTLVMAEIGIIFSFYPFSVWHIALFVMSFIYISLGILHNFLKGRLFAQALTEYLLVAIFVLLVFIGLFPGK